jgi:hypothetical protein
MKMSPEMMMSTCNHHYLQPLQMMMLLRLWNAVTAKWCCSKSVQQYPTTMMMMIDA